MPPKLTARQQALAEAKATKAAEEQAKKEAEDQKKADAAAKRAAKKAEKEAENDADDEEDEGQGPATPKGKGKGKAAANKGKTTKKGKAAATPAKAKKGAAAAKEADNAANGGEGEEGDGDGDDDGDQPAFTPTKGKGKGKAAASPKKTPSKKAALKKAAPKKKGAAPKKAGAARGKKRTAAEMDQDDGDDEDNNNNDSEEEENDNEGQQQRPAKRARPNPRKRLEGSGFEIMRKSASPPRPRDRLPSRTPPGTRERDPDLISSQTSSIIRARRERSELLRLNQQRRAVWQQRLKRRGQAPAEVEAGNGMGEPARREGSFNDDGPQQENVGGGREDEAMPDREAEPEGQEQERQEQERQEQQRQEPEGAAGGDPDPDPDSSDDSSVSSNDSGVSENRYQKRPNIQEEEHLERLRIRLIQLHNEYRDRLQHAQEHDLPYTQGILTRATGHPYGDPTAPEDLKRDFAHLKYLVQKLVSMIPLDAARMAEVTVKSDEIKGELGELSTFWKQYWKPERPVSARWLLEALIWRRLHRLFFNRQEAEYFAFGHGSKMLAELWVTSLTACVEDEFPESVDELCELRARLATFLKEINEQESPSRVARAFELVFCRGILDILRENVDADGFEPGRYLNEERAEREQEMQNLAIQIIDHANDFNSKMLRSSGNWALIYRDPRHQYGQLKSDRFVPDKMHARDLGNEYVVRENPTGELGDYQQDDEDGQVDLFITPGLWDFSEWARIQIPFVVPHFRPEVSLRRHTIALEKEEKEGKSKKKRKARAA